MTQPEFIYLDSNFLAQCIATLSKSDAKADQHLAQYLKTYKLATRHDSTAEVCGAILREANAKGLDSFTINGKRLSPRWYAKYWGKELLGVFLEELRKLICGKGKTPSKLSEHSVLIVSLGSLIVQKFHIADATATGLVVFLLLKVGQVTKNTFCRMTDPEVIAALEEYKPER